MSSNSHSHPKMKHLWIWISAFVIVAISVFFIVRGDDKEAEAKKAKPVAKPVPVATSNARQDDIGIYLEALGTVTPVYTVNIISRVQGQIVSVNYKEGQVVHKGDSILEIDPRPYDAALLQAQGQLMKDEAVLKESQIDLKRYKTAYAKNAIAKQQLDDQEQAVFQDEGAVKSDEGTVENAKANLDYCHIQSPIEGRVGLRLVDPGNMVQSNSTTALAVITQLQPIDVVFSVSEDHLGQVQEQLQKGKQLSVDLYDRSKQHKIATGKLLTIDNVVDPTTGTVKFKAEFVNEDNSLFPNQFVNARLLVDTEQRQILISSSAIQRNAQGAFVYIVKSDQTAEMRKITVGAVDGDNTAVTNVKAEEVVVVTGFDKLGDGSKVAVRNESKSSDLQQTQKANDTNEDKKTGQNPQPASTKSSNTGLNKAIDKPTDKQKAPGATGT
jgi:multidrug efflux system membrane fusion protein